MSEKASYSLVWGPPCQCGGEYIPHRHGSSTGGNSPGTRTQSNILLVDTRLRAIADAWNDGVDEWLLKCDVRREWPELADLLDALVDE